METLQSYTIRHIRESIPRVVLEKAFLSPTNMVFGASNSLDTAIELAVLRDSVCRDVQVIASMEEVIDLSGLPISQQPNGGVIVQIPADRRGGRPILSVIKFCFLSSGSLTLSGHSGFSDLGTVDNKLNRIVDGYGDPIATETTRCRMITPSTMVADLNVGVTSGLSAVVNLEVGEQMDHIPRTAWDRFKRMALQKCKQLVYTNLICALAEGAISRGVESDVITNIIGEYSSSDENYNELYTSWRRTEIFLDDKRMAAEIRARLPR